MNLNVCVRIWQILFRGVFPNPHSTALLRPRHSGVTGAPTALCFCTHPPHPFSCLGFPPGDVSWRHMTSLGVAGLKYLEPSCSAGGARDALIWTSRRFLDNAHIRAYTAIYKCHMGHGQDEQN